MKSDHAIRLGLSLLSGAVVLGTSQAGELPSTVIEEPAASNPGNFCDWLTNKPGTLYKNSENPWFQGLQIFGRFQWQAAYLSGEDVNGYEFSDDYTEVRRFRMGAAIDFLQYFKLKANVNLVDDARSNTNRWPGNDGLGWGYENFDEATLTFDIKKAFNLGALDELTISYGRHKFELGEEARESSKNIFTVERSAISNKVYGSYRPTGVHLHGVKGPWDVTAAVYSTDADVNGSDVDFIGGWNDGLAYFIGVGYTVNDQWSLFWDFVYNDANATAGEDSLWDYEWATSFSVAYQDGPWGWMGDVYFGDNGDADNGVKVARRQGNFWGAVVMPYYWIVDKKLQAVVRYQYAGSSEDQGIRTNSRYVRRDHGPVANVNSGRGNEHHSIYAGLNYLICGDNLKIMTGVEYEWLNTPGVGLEGDVTATTLWCAFRTYF